MTLLGLFHYLGDTSKPGKRLGFPISSRWSFRWYEIPSNSYIHKFMELVTGDGFTC